MDTPVDSTMVVAAIWPVRRVYVGALIFTKNLSERRWAPLSLETVMIDTYNTPEQCPPMSTP